MYPVWFSIFSYKMMLWWKSINIFYFEHVQVNVQNKFLEVELLDQV